VISWNVVGFDIYNVVVVEGRDDLAGGWKEWNNIPPEIHEISMVTN